MRTTALLTLAVLFSATLAVAQPGDQLARVEIPGIRTPALLVRPDGKKPSAPLAVSNVDVDVVIAGNTAETTMTLTFANHLDRVLEGTLYFPLPEGSTVTGYALDIEGDMIDAVIVEKHRARYIFEAEQRKGIDPGLVEWVKGNNFKTRVWPIPAKGARTVRVEHVSELPTTDDGKTVYVLPLKFPMALERLDVSVRSLGDGEVQVQGGDWIKTRKGEDATVVEGHLKAAKPKQDLVIVAPARGKQVHVARRPKDRQYYFAINDRPTMPAVDVGVRSPNRIGLFWDVSLSRAKADTARELELVENILKSAGNVTVDVVLFSNEIHGRETFTVKSGDAGNVVDALRLANYDGGTSLGKLILPADTHGYYSKDFLRRARMPAPARYDYHLLFTDGLDNLGDELPRRIHPSRSDENPPAVPVYAFANDSRANHPLLRHLCQSHAGAYFNLQKYPGDQLASIAGSISHTPALIFRLTKVEYDPQRVADVFPNTPTRIQGRVSVAGRLLANEATVKLHFAYGPKTTVATYTLRQDEKEFNRLIPRIWAQKKVDSLLAFPEKHRDELIALGRKFGFVTPGTSLLVLETLDQYLEYGVEPPQSREKMHLEWTKQIEEQKVAKEESRQEKVKDVVAMWNERVKWWEKEYKYPKNFVYRDKDADKAPEADPAEAAPGAPDANAVPRNQVPAGFGGQGQGQGEGQGQGGGGFGFFGGRANGEAEKKDGQAPTPASSITLAPWNPKTPYLKAMTKAGPGKAYEVYLSQRDNFAGSPAFYLDCASYFFREGSADSGARVLTNVVELQLEDPRLTRIVAHKLQQEGNLELAVALFEKVLKLRPEEPQSYRDLALALSDRGQAKESLEKGAVALGDYRRAVSLLHEVVLGEWDDRFPGIETIALMELNRLVARAGRLEAAIGNDLAGSLDPRLKKLLDVDIRILLSWDTDLTDIDAWIIEPSGEKCYYSHNRTTIGGMMTEDFTNGYGPEVYSLRRAMPGKYKIMAHFYGSSQQELTGGTTIAATVITNYGRPNETRKSITVRLSSEDDEVDIGSIDFGKK